MVQFAPYLGPQGVLPYICHGYVPVCADPLGRAFSLQKHPFLLAPNGEEREETDVYTN